VRNNNSVNLYQVYTVQPPDEGQFGSVGL